MENGMYLKFTTTKSSTAPVVKTSFAPEGLT